MDDIEAVIDASRHYKFHDPQRTEFLNRLSQLPESKRKIKRAIKERMQLLAGAYISLATFVDDDWVDLANDPHESGDKEKLKKISKIYKKVLNEIDTLTKEIKRFRPLEVTNTEEEATL